MQFGGIKYIHIISNVHLQLKLCPLVEQQLFPPPHPPVTSVLLSFSESDDCRTLTSVESFSIFCDQLISFSIISSRLIHRLAYDTISFFFKSWVPFHCMRTWHILLTLQLWMNNLGCSHILAILNNAAMIMTVQMSL